MSNNNNPWDDIEEEPDGDFGNRVMTEIPDGVYPVVCTDFSVFQGKTDPSWFQSWWFKVEGGPFDGAELQRFTNINTSGAYAKKDIRVALDGEAPPAWNVLMDGDRVSDAIRSRIVGARFNVRQRTRKKRDRTYVDVFINDLTALPQPVEQAPEPADEPFNVDTGVDIPAPIPDAPTGGSGDDGWGDPDCAVCSGAGCDDCIQI